MRLACWHPSRRRCVQILLGMYRYCWECTAAHVHGCTVIAHGSDCPLRLNAPGFQAAADAMTLSTPVPALFKTHALTYQHTH